MSWFKKKPKDVVPNPRDKRKRRDEIEIMERGILLTAQFLTFGLALILLALVSL